MSGSADIRVLMSAYQCGPGMGSVSQIGWEWYSRMSRRARVTLVTHIRNRAALSAAGAPLPRSEILYIDTEWFAGPLYRLASKLFPKSRHPVFLVSSLDFFVYDYAAARRLRGRVGRGQGWDVVHAVTPLTAMAPTRLHGLGAPMVWGPLNNGVTTPAGFPDLARQGSTWLYNVRGLGRAADGLIRCSRRSEVILTATRATRRSLPKDCLRRCVSMIENGVDFDVFRPTPWPRPPGPGRPLRALFVGRLLPLKAVHLLFGAMACLARSCPIELVVVGDGPMREDWERRAERLGLAEAVTFTGALPPAGVARRMSEAHVLCLPSVRESGGAVLLEAMASRRPVIAVAAGGPAEVVDDGVGRAVSARGPEEALRGFRDALADISRRPDEWRERGEEGCRRARTRYGWEAKVDRGVGIYLRTIEARRRGLN